MYYILNAVEKRTHLSKHQSQIDLNTRQCVRQKAGIPSFFKFRTAALCMLGFVLPLILLAQEKKQQTEIIIIGSVHSGNKHITNRVLTQQLTQLQPHIVLWEYDKDFKKVLGLLTLSGLGIVKGPIEQVAIQRYLRKNKTTPVFGFDIHIPNRKKYIKDRIENDDSLHKALLIARLDSLEAEQYTAYQNGWQTYGALIEKGTLEQLNAASTHKLVKQLYEWEQTIIIPLAQKYIPNKELVLKYEQEQKFWIERNDFMVARILEQIKKHPGKRIVLLTGNNHHYYLKEGLLNQSEVGIHFTEWNGGTSKN